MYSASSSRHWVWQVWDILCWYLVSVITKVHATAFLAVLVVTGHSVVWYRGGGVVTVTYGVLVYPLLQFQPASDGA